MANAPDHMSQDAPPAANLTPLQGAAVLAASVLAGLLWEVVGPTATFGAGAAFSLVALAGLALVRTKTPAG